jgi:hypothetical protein
VNESDTTYQAIGHLILVNNPNVEFIHDDTFKIKFNGNQIKIMEADSIISTGKIIGSDQIALKFGDRYNIYFPLKESNMPYEYMLADSLRNKIWHIPINNTSYIELMTNDKLQDYPTQFKRQNLRTGYVISGMTNYMNHYFYSIYDLDGLEGIKMFHITDIVEGGYKIDYYDVEGFYNTGYHQTTMREIQELTRSEKEIIENKLFGTWSRSTYPLIKVEWEQNQDIKNSYWQLTLSKGKYIYRRGGIFDNDTIHIESEGNWNLGINGKYLELYNDTFKVGELPPFEDEYDFFQFVTIETLSIDSMKVNMNIESLQKGYLDDGDYMNSWQANVPFMIYRQ